MDKSYDIITDTYLKCAEGGDAPDVVISTGRVARSFGVEITDEDLDVLFMFRADGTRERLP